MSVRLLLSIALFLAACAGGGLAYGAASTGSALGGVLAAPPEPELLGPIGAEGRSGWACVPERAAESAIWKDAHLPDGESAR